MRGVLSWYAAAHGLTALWWLLCGACVLVAAGLQHLPLPPVNPDPYATFRPLETLGTVFGLVVSGVLCQILPERCRELTATASRPTARWRLTLLALVCGGGCLIGAIIGLASPPTAASPLGAARTYGLIVAVQAAAQLWKGPGTGLLIAGIFVAAMTRADILPWSLNVLYNPEARLLPLAVLGVAWMLAAAGAIRRPR